MKKTELMSELKRWCHGEGLDETHALMTIVPEDVEISEVEETMGTIKCLGRVLVCGRNFSARLNQRMILCECKEVVREESVLPEVVGKTLEDLKSLFPKTPLPTSSTESILAAVGDLLDKATKPVDGGSYMVDYVCSQGPFQRHEGRNHLIIG